MGGNAAGRYGGIDCANNLAHDTGVSKSASSLSGLFTRVEIGHIFMSADG